MRYILPAILILAIIAAMSIGMHSAKPRADLVVVPRGSIHTLDPAQMSYMQDIQAAQGLWEGLTAFHPVTTQAIEGTALFPPDMSADGKRYLFTLRAEARWSNGDPVVAADFVRAWRRAFEPGTAETYASLISDCIDGANDYVKWRNEQVGVLGLIRLLQKRSPIKQDEAVTALLSPGGAVLVKLLDKPIPKPPPEQTDLFWTEAIQRLKNAGVDYKKIGDGILDAHIKEMEIRFAGVGMKAIDARHLEVRLARPTAYFLDLTAFSTYLPLHASIEMLRETYEGRPLNESGLWAYDPQWTKPDYHRNGYPGVVCNGPYRLTGWRFKQCLHFEANPYFWNRANVRSKTIDLMDIDYQSASFMLFDQGQIDWLTDLTMDYTPELVREVREGKRQDIHAIPSFGTYWLNINCRPYLPDGRKNPFTDPRVRRALNRAINKKDIAEYVERLGNPVSTTLVPPGTIPGYRSPKGLSYDPEAARKELAEAGYPGGKGLPVIEILFNTSAGHEGKMQAVKRMWEQELGLKITLMGKETQTFAEDKDRGRFMISRGNWFGDYNDPTTFLDLCQSDNGNNHSKINDPKYDALLAKAAVEIDSAKRMEILTEAERIMMEEQLPLIPIYTMVMVDAWRPNVKGGYPNPRLQFPLQYIYVEK